MIDLDSFDAITFDCFGTLIDWPAGTGGPTADLSRRIHLGMEARHAAHP